MQFTLKILFNFLILSVEIPKKRWMKADSFFINVTSARLRVLADVGLEHFKLAKPP